MVTTFYPPYHFGGDGEAIQRLVHALARRGHHVDVIHDIDAFRALTTQKLPEPLPQPEGVRVHGLRSLLPSFSCLITHQTGRPIVHGAEIKRILGEGFDVIHYHNASLVGGPGVLSYGEGIKLYTAHEHWLVCPTHVLWRHNRELCTGRQCLRCAIRHRRPPQLWRWTSLLDRQADHVDAFLTLSEFSGKKHAEFGFDRPMTLLPTFLEADAIGDAVPPLPDVATPQPTPPYFFFAGRLEAIKGLQNVIPAFTGEGGSELWIAGSGKYEKQLRAVADGSPRVRFLGRLPPHELRDLYRNALGVVMPSICYEVFPMVVLEAFRDGAPIIANAVGPFPEIVQQSGGGLLYETTEELEEALSRLENDAVLRQRLGKAGERAFHANWSESVALRAYFQVIEDVARDRGMSDVLGKLETALAL